MRLAMSVLKIEAAFPLGIEEAVGKKNLAEEVCKKCPMLESCQPRHSLDREEINHLESLREMFDPSYKKRYVVRVYGFNAGDSECLLTKDSSPVEFKQL